MARNSSPSGQPRRRPERGDRGAPADHGPQHRAARPPDAADPTGRDRADERAGRGRGVQQADGPGAAAVQLGAELREQRPRHAEHHRVDVDQERALHGALPAQVAQSLLDRAETRRGYRRLPAPWRACGSSSTSAITNVATSIQYAAAMDTVRDDETGEGGTGDLAELVAGLVQRGGGRDLVTADERRRPPRSGSARRSTRSPRSAPCTRRWATPAAGRASRSRRGRRS